MGNNKYIEWMWGISISDVTGAIHSNVRCRSALQLEVVRQGCRLLKYITELFPYHYHVSLVISDRKASNFRPSSSALSTVLTSFSSLT